ncbi:acyltransferase family protein [Campylobacter sp. RM16187]|uniref:acyltransferase family protein n=1 Tax=Campylobacter sp. RM16187 TaxID=1660063 RepID=UPI0021B517B4|nr:acyltransferase [Campylobacter sp. RM16187]QKG30336.1 acyltransferase [Campylobacter sp. RM16187]
MFGYLRFFLAYLVVINHLNFTFMGKYPGVFAVIIFYILAGFVTSKIFLTVSPNNIKYFLIDRFLRIYPLFFVISIITLIFFIIVNFNDFKFDVYKIFLNLTLIPLNYFFFIDVGLINTGIGLNFLVPPAWSLSAEIQAYILLIIAIKFKKIGLFMAIFSLCLFILAHLSFLDSDIHGYRLVSSVFFIFYSGYLLFTKKYKILSIFILPISILFVYLFFKGFGFLGFETIFGFLVGIIVISMHNRIKIKLPFNGFFGNLSYIIFLNHFLCIWLYEYFFNSRNILFISILSIVFGIVLYLFIEKPITKHRLSK